MIFLNYSLIGQKIKKARKQKGLSQEQLAEMVWISTTHMSHIETGSTKLSLPVLADIAQTLNISTDYLIFDENNGNTNQNKESDIKHINNILKQCSPDQVAVISEVVKSIKTALDKY